MSAVLAKKSQAELLEQITDRADLTDPVAKKAATDLANSFWTKEDQERGRQLGRERISLNARSRRLKWFEESVRLIVDGFDAGNFITDRSTIIEGLRSFSNAYGIEGRRGGTVKFNTISKWFTDEVKNEAYIEAVNRLITRRKP